MRVRNFVQLIALLTSFSAFAGQEHVEIIGGTLVTGSAPLAQRTVGLYFQIIDNGQTGAAVCSGSILDANHILTAAHCVQGFQSGYIVFSNNKMFNLLQQAAQSGIASTSGLVVKMDSAKALPGFPGMSNANNNNEFVDLAIISFSGGLPAGYEPAKFLPKSAVLAALSQNQTVTLSGYGMTSAPPPQPAQATQSGRRPHSPATPATPSAPPAGNSNSGFPAGVGVLRQVDVTFSGYTPRQLDLDLTGFRNHIACEGDSGGPALINYQGESYVIGVDSRGDCSQHAIYTLVDQENLASSTSAF